MGDVPLLLLQVGKGLSKDDKAQKLALQHWLEAVWLANILFKHSPIIALHTSNSNSIVFHGQIDPRHRYGHNLHYYYKSWLHCDSQQPFFYWYSSCWTLYIIYELDQPKQAHDYWNSVCDRLDVGEGKEINLEDHCPRWKLQQQCIRYLGPVSCCDL